MTLNINSHMQKNPEGGNKSKTHNQFELGPSLQALERFAVDKYSSYQALAESFDDAQAEFTSKAVHFLQGNKILAMVALRSAELAQKNNNL